MDSSLQSVYPYDIGWRKSQTTPSYERECKARRTQTNSLRHADCAQCEPGERGRQLIDTVLWVKIVTGEKMINCLSVKCSLAFAPYILETLGDFIADPNTAGRLVKQGGFGMTFHSDGDLIIHHQNRESRLDQPAAAHYLATIDFRRQCFEIVRMADEVVFATVGNQLFISYPQSDLWLDSAAVSELVGAHAGQIESSTIAGVTYSVGGGRLMISDQHNGRWVLLGGDHTAEMERRIEALRETPLEPISIHPPTISIKGVAIHLQSAFNVADALRRFASTGELDEFAERAPTYSLVVSKCSEGVELRDTSNRAALTKRETVKWADIIEAELDALKAVRFERGAIRTAVASVDGGKWVLQWGDEVFLPKGWYGNAYVSGDAHGPDHLNSYDSTLRLGQISEFALALDRSTGACIALTAGELAASI